MKKVLLFFTGLIFLSVISCSQDSGKLKHDQDSIPDDSIARIKNTPDTISNSQGVSATTANENFTVPSLLKKLPLLKFPMMLDVDSFEKASGIPVALQKNIPWFGDFLHFPVGTKVAAIGKCFVDPGTEGVLFFTSAPNPDPGQPDDVELIMSLFEGGRDAVDSRIVSIKCSAGFGKSNMRNPIRGKSFEQEQNGNIKMTFTTWGVKNGAFYETSKKQQNFTADKKGKNESSAAGKLWLN
jgi:hypothetical protein